MEPFKARDVVVCAEVHDKGGAQFPEWVKEMYVFVGTPMVIEDRGQPFPGWYRANRWWWHESWLTLYTPPKAVEVEANDWNALMKEVERISAHRYPEGDTAFFRTFGMLDEDGKYMARINRFSLHTADTLFDAVKSAVDTFNEYSSTLLNTDKK